MQSPGFFGPGQRLSVGTTRGGDCALAGGNGDPLRANAWAVGRQVGGKQRFAQITKQSFPQSS